MTTDDARLIQEYVAVGVEVDDLPYTVAMVHLAEALGRGTYDEALRDLYCRLKIIERRGGLPRVYAARTAAEREGER